MALIQRRLSGTWRGCTPSAVPPSSEVSGERAPPAGAASDSTYSITALTVREQPIQASCSWVSSHIWAADAASWRQVERFFHQSVFESMPLTGLDRDGVLERSPSLLGALDPAQQHTVLPWDDPPSFANLQLNIKEGQGRYCRRAEPPGCLCINAFGSRSHV